MLYIKLKEKGGEDMITVDKLSIETLDGRKLIENLSFQLSDGDKLAVIGEEGNGKSTLLKAIIDFRLLTLIVMCLGL